MMIFETMLCENARFTIKKSCQWGYLPGLGWRDRCCATPELCRIRNHPQSSAYSFHKRVVVVTPEGMAGHMCNVSSPMWQLKSCINRINICTFTSQTCHTIRVVHKPETVLHSLDITSRTCAAGASQLKCFGGRQWHHGFGQLCLWSETGHMNWKIQAILKWQAKTWTKSDLVSKEEKHSIRFGVYFTGGHWMSPGTSNLSKQGSPSPTGIPDTTVVTAPGLFLPVKTRQKCLHKGGNFFWGQSTWYKYTRNTKVHISFLCTESWQLL